LLYDGFVVNATNEISLSITNEYMQRTNLTVVFRAFNGVRTNEFNIGFNIDTAPSAELLTKTVYTPRTANSVTLRFNNNTSGDSSVKYLKVVLPDIYTNIATATSDRGVVETNEVDNLVIYYADGLAKGESDNIVMSIMDNKGMFETNGMEWVLYADNGTGYGRVREFTSGDLKQNMRVPLPQSDTELFTSWFNIRTTMEYAPTNEMIMTIINSNEEANVTYSNIIELPSQLAHTIDYISSLGTISKIADNRLLITYDDPYFSRGDTNYVSFKFTNTVALPANALIRTYSYNGSSLGHHSKVDQIAFRAPTEPTEAYVAGKKIIYSIDNSETIVYHINNGMYDVAIERVRLRFDTQNLIITDITSKLYGNVPYTTTSSNIVFDYTGVGGIPTRLHHTGGKETLTFHIAYTNNVNWTNDMKAEVRYEKSVQYEETRVPSGERDFLPVLVADFGRVLGIVLPGNANPSVKFYKQGEQTPATNKFGEDLVMSASSADGTYTIDFIPDGTYDIGFVGQNYRETKLTNIRVVQNRITNIGTYRMKREAFDPNASGTQSSICLDDMVSEVIVPAGALGEYFSLDIWRTNMNNTQISAMQRAKNVKSPLAPDDVTLFYLDMKGLDTDERTQQELKNNLIIKLHYYMEEIEEQGWSEDSLAIYYWREMSNEWVRIGGKVDKNEKTVTAKVGYLHRYYAIFGEKAMETIVPGFVSVTVDPKIFTPTANERDFKNIKISVGFSEEFESYEVMIFNLQGNLVRHIVNEKVLGQGFTQGEVFWNGLDEDGYPVKTGVYVYRIIAGGNVFSGTIVVAR